MVCGNPIEDAYKAYTVEIKYQIAPQLLTTSLVISDMYKNLSQLISLIVLDTIKIVSLLLVV